MILRKIEIENYGTDTEFSYNLKKRAKHITNYVNRTCLQKIRFQSAEFGIIVIALETSDREVSVINNGLVIPVIFDQIAYNKLGTENAIRAFYTSSIVCGLKKVQSQYNIPEMAIIKSLNEFESKEFRNEWLHKRKTEKQRKIEVALNCKLSIVKFELWLKVSIGGTVVCEQIVLETDPDEVAFEYKFNDIIIDNDTVRVTKKISGNLLEYSIKNGKLKICE